MTATVVIPARFGSTRFPGKMVASQTGKPLVQHVVERANAAKLPREVIVATDDVRIVEALRPFGTKCVMTRPDHPSGTDRIAEVARSLSDEIIVNVQGDEPEIESSTIDRLIERMRTSGAKMATAVTPFAAHRDPNDPNIVKAVLSQDGSAIYFSRHAIPFHRDKTEPVPTYYHHLGIYGYDRVFLLEYATWTPTPLETAEKLEQLRALEHGVKIDTIQIDRAPVGIDTPQQYAEFVKRSRP